ncbi:TIGR03087 family PEP-CTERM/XrtA system glycosyltransferase [Novosphingobium colocasiae]|uniref:TIGR03087 family PEP-CTERM/XrtA system glycosyltransferase n=1 Tax=Novosphingobium colocasiae TaxID=1256513 RepID=UPI0035AF6507
MHAVPVPSAAGGSGAARPEILFLSHRIPFPPDRGDKIRSFNVLQALARLGPVHVATFADDAEDMAHEGALAGLAASHCLLLRTKSLARSGIEALIAAKPVSLTAFRDARFAGYVAEVLRTRPIAAIYVFSGQMGQYLPNDFDGRIVADLVDVDSAKFEAYAAKSGGFRGWMEQREARLLAAEEARIAALADHTLLISAQEAALFRGRLDATASAGRIAAMGNGIDSALFDAKSVQPEPRLVGHDAPRLIFTGQMDYPPNVDAALRAIRQLLPRIRARVPEASLHIVGRNPVAALTALDGRDGVHVWGKVPDVRPWLAAADIALVPLEIARGVQNKVLEAMAMRLPVVLTTGAATGIEARDQHDYAIADSDDQLVEAVVALAGDPGRAHAMGAAARAWIVGHAGWEAALAPLGGWLGLATRHHADAA